MPTIVQNDLFADQWQIDADIYANIGARYSGKTREILQRIVLDCIEYQGIGVAIFRHTYASIKDSVYSDLLSVLSDFGLEKGKHYNSTVSPLYISIGKSFIVFKGLDDPEKIKGLAQCHYFFIEEASEIDRRHFDTILLSIRGKGYKKRGFIASNPVPSIPGSPHWLQETFFSHDPVLNKNIVYEDDQLGRVVVCKSNYKANRFTPNEVVKILEGYKETNPALYEMWVLGNFARVEGVILTNWRVVSEQPDNRLLVGYGLDFGFSSDPAACTKVWIDRKSRIIWAELIMYNTNFTNYMIGMHLKDAGVQQLDKIVFDSAEPKSGEEIYKMGYRGMEQAKKRANYKTEMAQYLQGYEIRVIRNSYSDKAKTELSTWAWQKDKHGNQMPKPTDGNDHFIDSMIMLLHNALAAPGRGGVLNVHF